MPRHLVFDMAVAVIVGAIFLLKITNYVDPGVLRPSAMRQEVSVAVHNTVGAISNLPALNSCPGQEKMQEISGGYVCAEGPTRDTYADIYRSYPLVGRGRESIYSSTDSGTTAAADDLLHNQFDLPRYKPVRLPDTPTWSEDPYSSDYWRFEIYSLRPTLNLLYAFRTTGNAAYARRLLHLDLSFAAAESRSRWAWADPHAVAFRSMSLVDTWWKLRQGHQLPEAASTVVLRELEKTGRFLADPNNYQIGENHGTNEAAALYEIAVAFPTLPHAHYWLTLAKQRFAWQLGGLIDADGQLIENSPFYDFYILEKYWQIYDYSIAQGEPVSADFSAKLRSMLNFATYIMQPNSQVPLLGASLERTINYFGIYREMAAINPNFQYVLTHGAKGSPPPVNSIYFPASALTIMRSGWPEGAPYVNSSYLTYNIGRYRTPHSDLAALGVTLYGDGGDLLTDPGLYAYTGPYHHYFHGTMSHNTVAVDGKSQAQGTGTAGPLITKDGMTYQSAQSPLYSGVAHRRLVMMLDATHFLIVDQLSSRSVHNYQQLFHLFPGAKLLRSGLTVSGVGGAPHREVTIRQLLPGDITEQDVINRRSPRPGGLCSRQYGVLLPCYQVSYSARGRDATFDTLITIGQPQQAGFSIQESKDGTHFQVTDGGRRISVGLGRTTAVAPQAVATDPKPPPVRLHPVRESSPPGDWTAAGGGILSSHRAAERPGRPRRPEVSLWSDSGLPVSMQDDDIQLNLKGHNARLRLRVKGLRRLSRFQIRLSNNHWASTVSMDARDSYTASDAGRWVSIFLGRSRTWGAKGGWRAAGPTFNWAKIDGVQIEMTTRKAGGGAATVSTRGMTLLPGQKRGKLVFLFDGGYQSILPAAQYLHNKGIPGNVAVIGKDVDYPVQGYLNTYQLRALQDKWGWDIVNHTQENVSAVPHYSADHNLAGFAADFLQQAAWLEANGLNSAPNWLIYPHGSVDPELERVVSRYYMFAGGLTDGPDAYPYGDRLAVNNLEIQYPGDAEGTRFGFTPPAQIISAVRQAARYHKSIILTFHRISSEASDPPGYPLALFKEVVRGIHRSGIDVLTLSQLDQSNDVPVHNRINVSPGRSAQITVQVSG